MPGLAETVATLRRSGWLGLESSEAGGVLQDVATFGANPAGLRMRIHVPEQLGAGAPLVVVLHGCSQTAEGYAAGAGWIDLAERYGFALVCPQQVRANNPNLCFNWFQPRDVARGGGEAASIRAMIAHAVVAHRLDRRRVFVTGLSAGGAMANVMLAAYPEVFAGGAIVAGLPYGSAANLQQALTAMRGGADRSPEAWGDEVRAASPHRGPWPRISIWHGDADAVVQPGAALQVASQWVDVHGAGAPDAERSSAGAGRRRLVWRDQEGRDVVELHRIAGMGHGVPLGCAEDDGCGEPGPFLLDVGISSSLEIARSWGLAGPPRPGSAQPRPGAGPPPLDLASRLVANVGRTVSDTLRKAGLSI